MKPFSFPAWTALLVLLCLACGCAGLGKRLDEPRISLTQVRVKEIGLFESVVHITLRLMNPNDVSLEIEGADCELKLKGHSVAHGVTNQAVTVPALGSELVTVEAYTSMAGITRTVLSTLRQAEPERDVAYTLTGRLHLGGRTFLSTLPFRMEGALAAGDLLDPK
jgi:LEA14-like dessication related protein